MDAGAVAELGWIVVAFVSGLAARACRLPPLVGYLAAGMGLAAFGVDGGPIIGRIGELGVALLLFIVGLDLRWKNFIQAEVLGTGSLHLIVTAALGLAGGVALGLPPLAAGAVGVSLGVSSLVLAATSLSAQNDLRAYHGRIAISLALMQAVVATVVMGTLGDAPSPWALTLLALPVARPVLMRLLDVLRSAELRVLFGLALVAACMIGFESVGVSGELGALTAGALLAGHDRTDALSDALGGIKDAFLAAFFLSVGLVGFPAGSDLIIVAALVGALALKAALFFGLLVGFRLKARTAFLAALPLTTYSGFTLIVGDAVVGAGLMDASALTVLALATAASYLLNAPIARHAPVLWRRVEPWLRRFERAGRHRDAVPQTLGSARFLVVGMGRAGTAAYDALAGWMQCPVGIDEDPKRLATHRDAGRRVLYGDARDASLWGDLDVNRLDAVVLAIPGRSVKLDVIRALRQGGFDGAISALTTDPDGREALIDAGANAVYLSVEQAGQALAAYGFKRRRDPVPSSVTLGVQAESETRQPDAASSDSDVETVERTTVST